MIKPYSDDYTSADISAAKHHLSAAIRELTRATDQSRPYDPRLDIADAIRVIRVIWTKL